MPWRIRDDHPDCAGFAVVKDDETGELVACHETREQAEKQLAALYANEPEARTLAAFEKWDAQDQIRSARFLELDHADDGSWFEGYAAVFDEPTSFIIEGVGAVSEEVRRGAFRRVLAEQKDPIPLLYHHLQEHPPLATTSSGRLRLEEDTKGLRVKAQVAKTYIGDAVRELVKTGDIPGMSWGFRSNPKKDSLIQKRSGGGIHRVLLGFTKILDVSPTWDVTYRGTSAEFRSRTLGLADSSAVLQQAFAGVPVLQPNALGSADPDGGEEAEASAESGVAEQRSLSVAARKRALDLYLLQTGGLDDASG